MKKSLKLFILAAGIMLFSGGCTVEKIKVVTQEEADKINKQTVIQTIRTVTIDGCEYLEYVSQGAYANYQITHKGNCKYCIERLEKNNLNRADSR